MNRVFLAGIVGFALVLSAGLFVDGDQAVAGLRGCNGGGLFAHHKARDCGGGKLLSRLHARIHAPKSCCGEPAPACCEPAPTCCEPAPAPCCEPAPAPCCEPAPAPCCAPVAAPCCSAPVAAPCCGGAAPVAVGCSSCGTSVNAGSIQVESASPSNAPAAPVAPPVAAPPAAAAPTT